MSRFFFKHFSLEQEGVAMRINTDGVLLGSWARLPDNMNTPKVLDIGTGGGVIALMVAQRLSATAHTLLFTIDAIEPHQSSALRAESNFKESPWASHTNLFNCSLQDYISQQKRFSIMNQYDVILSNPPYFVDSLRPSNHNRQFVRHTDSLSHTDLLKGVIELLHPLGCFCVVLPVLQQKSFVAEATTLGLYLRRETFVYSVAHRPPIRALMEFILHQPHAFADGLTCKQEESLQSDSLLIYDAENKDFSIEYKQLTKNFYLGF